MGGRHYRVSGEQGSDQCWLQPARPQVADDVGERRDGAGMTEVQAHDRTGLGAGPHPFHDGVGAGIGVVEWVDVEVDHGAVARDAGLFEDQGVAWLVPDGRKYRPWEGARRASTSRHRAISEATAPAVRSVRTGWV